jgi:hypothetical protein
MFFIRNNEPMKLRVLSLMLAVALASFAQTAAPTAPASRQDTKTCACCNHDKAEGSASAGCNDCCKDGKCPMMSGDHKAMKCPMMAKDGKMADGKQCCSSNKCPMHAKDGKGGCCCGSMDKKNTGM